MRQLSTVALAISVLFIGVAAIASEHYDFRAFYCSGLVSRQGADPYRTEPLYACERTQTHSNRSWLTNGPLPAPFPPYVIASVFVPVSLLPYRLAAGVWSIGLFAALLASIVLLARSARCTPALPAAVLCLSAGIASVSFGEITPYFFVFFCAATGFAQGRRWFLASCCAVATLLEPHLGLPVCVALVVWQRECRLPVGAGLALLAIVSAGAFGLPRTLEYLHPVLRYHALSEIGSDRQFSLTGLLHALGASDASALALGTASYIAATIVGVLVAKQLSRRFHDTAFLVATPAAFVLCGGVFLHVTQIIAAVPLALLLMRHMGDRKVLLGAGLTFLAIPWVWQLNSVVAVMGVYVAFAVAWEVCRNKAALGIAIPAFACVVALAVIPPPLLRVHHAVASSAIDPAYAERSWADQNAAYLSTGGLDAWGRRLPTWLGLFIVLGAALGAAGARSGAETAILMRRKYSINDATSRIRGET